MKTFRISLLGPEAFDVTISATLPDEAAMAVRKIVRDAAIGTATPAVRAGLLALRLSHLAPPHDCALMLEVSNKPNYSGYVVTIGLEGNHIIIEDFANNGNTKTVDFSDLDTWVAGPDCDAWSNCETCGNLSRYCSCDD